VKREYDRERDARETDQGTEESEWEQNFPFPVYMCRHTLEEDGFG
jgi:hypothetical protein